VVDKEAQHLTRGDGASWIGAPVENRPAAYPANRLCQHLQRPASNGFRPTICSLEPRPGLRNYSAARGCDPGRRTCAALRDPHFPSSCYFPLLSARGR